jgi:Flp pilus assembly protein TadD
MRWIVPVLVGVWLFSAPMSAHADQTDPALDELFSVLKTTTDSDEALRVEVQIWSIWMRRGSTEIDRTMALGIQAMSAGAYQHSIMMFDRIIALAPDYAEAWNKRATAYYLAGKFENSVSDIQKTLVLEPRHFGALSGMGMIYDAIGKPEAAVNVWQKALSIHPHLNAIRERVSDIKEEIDGLKL